MISPIDGWLFWALLSAGFAALAAIFAKLGVADIQPDLATFIRTLMVVAFLAAVLAMSGQWRAPAIPAGAWLFLALSGLATGASWLCYFRALKHGDAARVAPVDKLSIVLVALFGAVFLGERLTIANWLGVALCAAGIVLIALK